jgi:5-methyltetrahydrofolate--homocysteine methyltransferase
MHSASILEKLTSGVLVSDGAVGTELQKRGLATGACPEEFNVSHPEVVEGIYRDYITAGSDIISTNSFGGNRYRLKAYGLENRVRELCKRAAEIARQVCPPGCFVAGSIGPTGEVLEPLGTGDRRVVQEAFLEQAKALVEGGVDLIIVETMMAIEEAELAVQAAKATGFTVAATMTFESGPMGFRTMWGVDIPTAVKRLSEAGADIVGSNCGRGFDEMVGIVREMRPLTHKPILAQPNAGLPQWIEGTAVYSTTPSSIEEQVERMVLLGANILGGCCGTGPEHVRTIRRIVDTVGRASGRG